MFFLYVLAGTLGGVLGGMGMGGGTVLIPILSIFFGLEQHVVQAVNLITFIPMSIIALIIHVKNKFIDFNNVIYIILSGLFSCFLGVMLAKELDGNVLKRCFGFFLVVLSVIQVVKQIKSKN